MKGRRTPDNLRLVTLVAKPITRMLPTGPMTLRSAANTLLLVWTLPAGCTPRSAPEQPLPLAEPAPVEAPAPEPEPEFAYGVVWTADENTPLRTEYGIATIAHPLTRLEVLGADSAAGLHVRCVRCAHPLEGWLHVSSVVYQPTSPAEAADGELAGFALAVRKAALERDLAALRPVMFERFTFSFGGGGGPADAFNRWRFEGFRSLDRLPELLDRGLASHDGEVWTAPHDFVTGEDYLGLRAGFRRTDGKWQWIYLVAGD